jgi:hypothetical protein
MKVDLTSVLPTTWRPYAKLVYAVLGVAALLVANGVLTGTAATVVTAIGAALGTGGVYAAPNRDGESVDERVAQDEYEGSDTQEIPAVTE